MRGRRWVVVTLAVLLVIATGVAVRARANLPAPTPPDAAPFAPGGTAGRSLEQRWRSAELDGQIYARPVMARGLVIVATENNSLYGLDPADGHIVWGPTNLGPATPIAELDRQGKPEGCGNIDPLGITGAPGVDEASGTVFAVGEVLAEPGKAPAHLFAGVDATTGAPRFAPFPIDPPNTDTKVLQQRPALAVANGLVYVGFGGLAGDCGDYHGWLVAVPASGDRSPRFYEVAANEGNWGGAIWAPAGPTIDSKGNVLVATGNSFEPPPDPAFDRGDAVIKLSPTLDEIGFWAPSTYRRDNEDDLDLGSTSPLLLTDDLSFQIGKSNKAYLIATNGTGENPLGGVGGEIANEDVCAGFGGSAYKAPIIFAACTTGMHGVELVTSGPKPALRVAWRATVTATGPPAVAGDLVWSTDPGHQTLYALDARTGEVKAQRDKLGAMTRFSTPTIAGDTVFVAAGNGITAITVPKDR
jgi:outer membrane protein assembly factor BamB